jgi:hypothetical protein
VAVILILDPSGQASYAYSYRFTLQRLSRHPVITTAARDVFLAVARMLLWIWIYGYPKEELQHHDFETRIFYGSATPLRRFVDRIRR